MISQKAMISRLQQAGYTVKITRSGWVTISKGGWDESYRSIRAAYNDKLN